MNQKLINLILKAIVAILSIIGIVLIFGAMQTDPEIDVTTDQALTDVQAVSNSVDFTIYLLWAGVALIALATIWGVIQNPKRFITTGIGIAVFGILVLIASSMVTVETAGEIVSHPNASEDSLFWGGLGIQSTFVLTIVAIALIVLQSGVGLFRYFQK